MKEEELRELHNIFNDCWKLLKEHANISSNSSDWDGFTTAGKEIWERHNKHPFSMTLISGIGDYLEKECMKQKGAPNDPTRLTPPDPA